MNYARNALESLRDAGIDEYQALTDSERSELTELLGDWNRIVGKENARLEVEAEEQAAIQQLGLDDWNQAWVDQRAEESRAERWDIQDTF
ncbi:hypothetical protein [Imhoffiella purpurea]|uniref:Uncharacterized protein n=1 Tax=Imhoffiella purpurea TaxID=1249627 RepID=W9V9M9_9GAMM|nr:hypothetical protein [Imhoffiella purpurea]EXJ13591.1 hypothetical protein D779_3594 [Imhoffiella purpurea]